MELEDFDAELLPQEINDLPMQTREELETELADLGIQRGIHRPAVEEAMARASTMIGHLNDLDERIAEIREMLASLPELEVEEPPKES
jgi:hypothetical protein